MRSEILPLNPRNPQQQRSTGQAKDRRVRGSTMRRIAPIRSLLFLLVLLAISAAAFAQFSVSVSFAPPELPVYEQTLCPEDGYIWTPGYWAYSDDDYYWVPGTWVEPPTIGLLWTPAYWGWGDGGYRFYDGYWGTTVGFYGGINYGYGYGGQGYEGGRWQSGHFYYNRSVNNVDITINRNVYNTPVRQSVGVRVSFNGGNGGVNARPTSQDQAAARERHIPPVAAQTQHVQAARAAPALRATANHGKPAVAATPRPGAINDRGVVPAKQSGASYDSPAANRAVAQPKAETPAARPENGATRPGQQNSRPETAAPPAARSNNQPEPRSNQQPAQRAQPPVQSERSQPQHTPPAAVPQQPAPREAQVSQPQHSPAAATRPAEKPQQQSRTDEKKQGEQKHEER